MVGEVDDGDGIYISSVDMIAQAETRLLIWRLETSCRRRVGYMLRSLRATTWPEASELEQNDEAMRALWLESAHMVGLPEHA